VKDDDGELLYVPVPRWLGRLLWKMGARDTLVVSLDLVVLVLVAVTIAVVWCFARDAPPDAPPDPPPKPPHEIVAFAA